MPVFDRRYWHTSIPEKYDAYIINLSKFIEYLLSQGFIIRLFNNHTSDNYAIADIMSELKRNTHLSLDRVKVIRNDTIADLIYTISEADIIVATRFHATVLPLRFSKPVIGISYHQKINDLLNDVGLDDYCLDIYNFTDSELCKKFNVLFSNIEEVKRNITLSYKQYSDLMDKQWDHIAELINTKINNVDVDI